MPTHGLCKSSRSQALSVRLPWRAVLLSAPSKHCARRRFAHTRQKPRGQRAGSPPPALSPPNAPAGRTVQLSKKAACCVGRESNPGQLLGRQLCSPLYHQRYTTRVTSRRRPQARLSILSPTPPPPLPCPDAPLAGRSAPLPAPPAVARRPNRATVKQQTRSTGRTNTGLRSRSLGGLRPILREAARERLRPHQPRATRGTQLPASSWPKPFSTGR